MSRVAQGGTITLRANVYRANGAFVDTADIMLTVLDPAGDPLAGFPVYLPPIVREDIGQYRYVWDIADDFPIAEYTALWTGDAEGVPYTGSETVEVVALGEIVNPYLTVDEFRALTPTDLSDVALQVLLDAAYQAIVIHSGPLEEQTEYHDGGSTYVFMRQQVGSISSVVETYGHQSTTLAADDWRLREDLYSLRRLWTGTHPGFAHAQGPIHEPYWGEVAVTYIPLDMTAERKRVQYALVVHDLNTHPGLTEQRIGEWSEKYAARSATSLTYAQEREGILSSLPGYGDVPGFA